jgi:myo-inositol-1(or 4)-monophosphatase
MDYQQLETICASACKLIRHTGSYIRAQLDDQNTVEFFEKGIHDFVTHVDKNSESMLIEGLSEILPGSGFLAEENVANTDTKEFMWIIDPLDGTTNFIHSIPLYCISVALNHNNQTILGIIYEINMQECFYSWQGSKAFLNGKEISVSATGNMDHALFATGFPYYDYSRIAPYMGLFSYLVQNTSGVRRLGSAAVDLAFVACGRFEGFYEYGLHPWDVAAGAFLVKQAGGKVCDFKGQDNYIQGREIIATNSAIFNEFMELTGRYF